MPTAVKTGIWINYIKRDYFDGQTSKDLVYMTYSKIFTPDGTLQCNYKKSGSDTLYFRYTLTYDGIQESLMSPPLKITSCDKSAGWFIFNLLLNSALDHDGHFTEHNYRVTGVNLYYSEYENPISSYKLVNIFDCVRNGQLTTNEHAWETTNKQSITLLNTILNNFLICNKGQLLYSSDLSYYHGDIIKIGGINTGISITESHDIGDYALFVLDDTPSTTVIGGAVTIYNPDKVPANDYVAEAYTGQDLIYVGDTTNYDDLSGYPIVSSKIFERTNTCDPSSVKSVEKMIIQTDDIMPPNSSTQYTSLKFAIGTPPYSFRLFGNSNLDAMISMDGVINTDYQHGDEVSLDINGNYSAVVKGRMFKGDIILDPDNIAEEHPDWIAYSELNQMDVCPVSNIITVPDREGGEITGLAEMFGRLVVVKKYGMYLLNITDPSAPATWSFQESIHNIGNIAKNAFLSVTGKAYVVFWDGIYAMSPNNLAETDSTPTNMLKISEPINDVFEALSSTNKEATRATYNQYTNEVCYQFGGSNYLYCYNIETNQWRMIQGLSGSWDIAFIDEEAKNQFYKTSNKLIYSLQSSSSSKPYMTTKYFNISDDREEVVRYITVKYKSTKPLTLYVYADHSNTEVYTFTLPAQTTLAPYTFAVRYRCKNLQIKIEESAASLHDVYIDKIIIEVD